MTLPVWLSVCVCLSAFFPQPYCCSVANIKLRETSVSRGPLLPSNHCHRPWYCLSLYTSLSLYISPVVLRQLFFFFFNSNCLITQVHFIHRFKQHPILVSMPQSSHWELLPSHFVAVLFGSAFESQMRFGCCSDSGTDTVIFHTHIIHKHTQKQSLPKNLLLTSFNNGYHYTANLRLSINVSWSAQVRQNTQQRLQRLGR